MSFSKGADKVFAAHPAALRDLLQIQGRAKIIPQVVPAVFYRIVRLGRGDLLAVERDEQVVQQLRFLEAVAKLPPPVAPPGLGENRRRLAVGRHAHHRAELRAQAVEPRPQARELEGEVAQPIRPRGLGWIAVTRVLVVGEKHRVTDRRERASARVLEKSRAGHGQLHHRLVARAPAVIVPPVGDAGARLLIAAKHHGERVGQGGAHFCYVT